MGVITRDQAVDIGGKRGRLARDAAASLRRVDAALGHLADVNEAWRSPEQADKNYAAYLRYLNGGPWAPIALPGNRSVHCFGGALDTDDTSDAQMRVWNDHGWFWTVYRDGKLVERWHLEYFANRDNHRHEGVPAGAIDNEETELMGALEEIQKMHDVTRNYTVDQSQRQHDVTRVFLGELSQKQHDVTRGFIIDSVVAAMGKLTPTIDEAAIKAAVTEAVAGVEIEPIDVDAIAERVNAEIDPVDIDAIVQRVNDEADERARERLAVKVG